MKMKTIGKIVAAITAVALCLGLAVGTFAEGEPAKKSVYASTDYANKSELFDALMAEQGGNATITFPAPEGYVEGETERVKFIVNGALIAEKYSDKTFVMPFCGVDLTFDGSFLASIGGDRIEIQIEKKVPILLYYTCPKCSTTVKSTADDGTVKYYTPHSGDLSTYTPVEGAENTYACPKCKSTFELSEAGEPQHNEVVTGGIQIIEKDGHAVVGDYVYELNIFSDNKAISDYGDKNSGVKATVKVGSDALSSAKSENSGVLFNVYAYLSQTGIYENMGATIDEAAGTATFRIVDRGWFFVAGDDFSTADWTFLQLLSMALPFIIIGVVVIAAGVVVLVVVIKKKKASAAAAAETPAE